MSSKVRRKPRIAVFKFASCDGCQLSLLDAEDELLGVAGALDIAYFPEASRIHAARDLMTSDWSRDRLPPTTMPQRIQEVRRQCKTLITIGACATAGGIQALRNWKDVDEFIRHRVRHPEISSIR